MFSGRVLQEDLKDGFGRPVAFKFLLKEGVCFFYLINDRLFSSILCVVYVKLHFFKDQSELIRWLI
jgi:hypothetical protein